MTKDEALLSVLLNAKDYDSLPQNLREDKDIVLAVLDKRPFILKGVWDLFSDDFDVAKKGLETDAGLFCYTHASDRLKDNKELAKVAIKEYRHTDLLRRMPDSLRADKEIVMLALKANDMDGLEVVSEELKDDEEVAELALKVCESQMEYVSDRLKADKDFALRTIGEMGWGFRHLVTELQKDREVAKVFFSKNGSLLRESYFTNDRELVEIAVRAKPGTICNASDELKKDREIALVVVSLDGNCLTYLPYFQGDKEIVRIAYRNKNIAIHHATEDLRNDRAFMFEAYQYDQNTLDAVGDNLREDFAFVLRLNMLECLYNFEVRKYKKPRK